MWEASRVERRSVSGTVTKNAGLIAETIVSAESAVIGVGTEIDATGTADRER